MYIDGTCFSGVTLDSIGFTIGFRRLDGTSGRRRVQPEQIVGFPLRKGRVLVIHYRPACEWVARLDESPQHLVTVAVE